MQYSSQKKPVSGSKAIALDRSKIVARYRLYLFISMMLAGTFAFLLHIIFGR